MKFFHLLVRMEMSELRTPRFSWLNNPKATMTRPHFAALSAQRGGVTRNTDAREAAVNCGKVGVGPEGHTTLCVTSHACQSIT